MVRRRIIMKGYQKMSEPQGPKDDGGSRTQEEGGKKKQATEPKISATKMAEKPISEIVMEYDEQDKQEGHEIEDLASDVVDDEPEETNYDDDYDEESSEGETDSQEDYEPEFDEQSSEGPGDASQEGSGPQDSGASQETEEELILRHVAAVKHLKNGLMKIASR